MKTIFLEIPSSDSTIQIYFRTPTEEMKPMYGSMQDPVDKISHPVGHSSLKEFYQMS